MKHIVAATTLGLSLVGGALAVQTTLYEWRDAKGVISYSQFAPPAGVKNYSVREISMQSFTPAQKLAIKSQLARDDAAMLADSNGLRQRIANADAEVTNALNNLAHAERALKLGREPRAGERLHNVRGGSRLLVTYFERQRQLEEAVQKARDQLTEAYRLRDAIQP